MNRISRHAVRERVLTWTDAIIGTCVRNNNVGIVDGINIPTRTIKKFHAMRETFFLCFFFIRADKFKSYQRLNLKGSTAFVKII